MSFHWSNRENNSLDKIKTEESGGVEAKKPRGEETRAKIVEAIKETSGQDFTVPEIAVISGISASLIRIYIFKLIGEGKVKFLRSEKNSSGKKGSKVDIYEWISNGNLEKKS